MAPIFWTPIQDTWLRNNVPHYHWKQLTKLFNEHFHTNYPTSTIKGHCRVKLNLFNNLDNPYSVEQDQWILSHPGIPYEQLTRLFNEAFPESPRSYDNLRHHAQRIGAKFVSRHWWTSSEVNLLTKIYNDHSLHQLSEIFHLSENAIQSKASELGIQKQRVVYYADFSKLEIYYASHYQHETNISIANKFNIPSEHRYIRLLSKKYRTHRGIGMKSFVKQYLSSVNNKHELWELWKQIHPEKSDKSYRRKLFDAASGKQLPRYATDHRPLGHILNLDYCIYVKTKNQTQNGVVIYPNYMDCYEKQYELSLGYKLQPGQKIVHLDGNYKNNNIENLRVVNHETAIQLNKNGWYGLGKITEAAIEVLETHQTLRKLSISE